MFLLPAFFFSLVYAILIRWILKHWNALPEFQIPPNYNPRVKVSIIVPARDEAGNIEACLKSLLAQQYPQELREIIIVDDFSGDGTPWKVRQFRRAGVRLLTLREQCGERPAKAHKKKAIETGIAQASGDLIVTTDADCTTPPSWLLCIVACYELSGNKMIAAPVIFTPTNNILEHFQALDYTGMMLFTGAGIRSGRYHLCNGANLAYEREAFFKIGGFSDTKDVASGDDVLLMQKMAARFPERIGFVKSSMATVSSVPQKNWKSFLQQRLRWASKSRHYGRNALWWLQAFIFTYYLLTLIYLGLALVQPAGALSGLLLLVCAKLAADYVYLKKASRYFDQEGLMRYFLPASCLHLFYILVVALFTILKKGYSWKGRRYY